MDAAHRPETSTSRLKGTARLGMCFTSESPHQSFLSSGRRGSAVAVTHFAVRGYADRNGADYIVHFHDGFP
jgi:hypothetical protein